MTPSPNISHFFTSLTNCDITKISLYSPSLPGYMAALSTEPCRRADMVRIAHSHTPHIGHSCHVGCDVCHVYIMQNHSLWQAMWSCVGHEDGTLWHWEGKGVAKEVINIYSKIFGILTTLWICKCSGVSEEVLRTLMPMKYSCSMFFANLSRKWSLKAGIALEVDYVIKYSVFWSFTNQ